MKARTFILTTSAIVALVVPAAHAANSSNRLHQTKMQTVLFEKGQQPVAKSMPAKCTTKSTPKKSTAKKSTAKTCVVAVPTPRVPARPVPATSSSVATNLPAGAYVLPNECLDANPQSYSYWQDIPYHSPSECRATPLAQSTATPAVVVNDRTVDTPPGSEPQSYWYWQDIP
jgi:hypothetical protein